MKLTVTPEAANQLKQANHQAYCYLQLRYDTEGCGCGVNGVPTIGYTNKKLEDDIEVENDFYPTVIKEQQVTFFANDMTLDFINGIFRLSSPEEILNPFITTQSIGEEGKVN